MVLTILLTVLLTLTGIFAGLGFYGLYKLGGGTMGAVALIMSIIGCTGASILILLGDTVIKTEMSFIIFGELPTKISVYYPNVILITISLLLLTATFVILGVASITTRKASTRPTAALAGGILSIIGGALLLIFSGLLGFAVLIVATITWSVVFFSSRTK